MSSSHPVVIFAPYAAIRVHSFPEALVASSIAKAGTEVLYVSCDGMMIEGCAAMSAYKMSPKSPIAARTLMCSVCRRQRDALSQGVGSSVVSMESFLTPDLESELATLASEIDVADIINLDIDGFKVGRIALHETILNYKLTALDELTSEALTDFRIRLLHVLRSLHVTKSLIQKHSPSRIITYNTHLSTNYIMMLIAEREGVPTFGLHAGGNMAKRLSSLYVFRRDMVQLYQDWIARFEYEWSSLPTTANGIRDAAQHFRALTSGQSVWVYSIPKAKTFFDVRAHYNISSNQRILLATLSSYDELFSSQMMGVMGTPPLMFETQIDWLNELIHYVGTRPDWFLIIRVHPREFPNHRDNVHSTHAKRLSEALVRLPPNIRVNWPEDGISLYDLIPYVDVGLNGWSSTGKELAFLGIPVVIYNRELLYYPANLNLLASDRDDYFRQIEIAIRDGWSFDRIRLTFRWLAVEYSLGTIDISEDFDPEVSVQSLVLRIFSYMRQMFTYRLESRRLRQDSISDPDFVKSILQDHSVIDLNLSRQPRLDTAEEDRRIGEELSGIVNECFGQVPHGVSSVVDALRTLASEQGFSCN